MTDPAQQAKWYDLTQVYDFLLNADNLVIVACLALGYFVRNTTYVPTEKARGYIMMCGPSLGMLLLSSKPEYLVHGIVSALVTAAIVGFVYSVLAVAAYDYITPFVLRRLTAIFGGEPHPDISSDDLRHLPPSSPSVQPPSSQPNQKL